MKDIYVTLLLLLFVAGNSHAGLSDWSTRLIQKQAIQIENAKRAAAEAARAAEEKKAAEVARKTAAELERKVVETRNAEEVKRTADQEKLRLQNIQQAEILKFESKNLVEQNAILKIQLENRKLKLDEIKLQLDAERQQLELQKKSHEKASEVLKQKTKLIEAEKQVIEDKAFLYSMGFWSSVGAIVLGLVTVVVRLPTIKLEREKLRKEIQHIELQVANYFQTPNKSPVKTILTEQGAQDGPPPSSAAS